MNILSPTRTGQTGQTERTGQTDSPISETSSMVGIALRWPGLLLHPMFDSCGRRTWKTRSLRAPGDRNESALSWGNGKRLAYSSQNFVALMMVRVSVIPQPTHQRAR